MRNEFAKLLKMLRKQDPNLDEKVIRKAYRIADKAHQGQMRNSGEAYITHCLAVARLLSTIHLDTTSIAAGLLHDVLEDSEYSLKQLEAEFGKEIALLVDGVTKISTIHMPTAADPREAYLQNQEKHAQNIRKMLVATAKDVRVLLIKLADRLHNMRTLEHLSPEKIERISRETLDIYAPLAHRLGIGGWRWELEDHAFHFLNPEEYRAMAKSVAMKRREREQWLRETIRFLEERLLEAEVDARVIGRPKHLYSIFQKMLQQGKDFDEVYDILAVRIITHTVSDCYNAIGVVHQLWTPVPGRFKDYIAMPKVNMYQSVHTNVMRENGTPMEIQIRTEEMDRIAREGVAAHWWYKEGPGHSDPKLDERVKAFRQMYEWLQDAHAPEELLDGMRRDLNMDDLYVFTPKGEVKEIPTGSTPLDFAYLIHSDIGANCIGARVNGRMVPLRYNLQMGDVVEILTSKNQTPHLDWVDIVNTGRARTKIRQQLRERNLLPPHEVGNTQSADQARPETPVRALSSIPKPVQEVDDETRAKLLCIDGKKGVLAQFARCCNPMPGHAILGYVTKLAGITIHRGDCKNFSKTERDPQRIVGATWEGEGHYETGLRVVIGQRPNVLADITNAMRPMNIDITKANYHPGKEEMSYFDFLFTSPDHASVERLARTLLTVTGVSEVQILSPDQLTATG